MRNTILTTAFLLCAISGWSQQVSGQISNSEGEPIASVNIGVVGKPIGTISNSKGQFEFNIDELIDEDTLRFSIVSFETQELSVSEIRASKQPILIHLNARVIELNEVVKTGQKRYPIQLGLKKKYCYPIPLYKKASSNLPFPQSGNHQEIGTRYRNNKSVSLDSVQLNFVGSKLDTVSLKLNIYMFTNDTIQKTLSKPIFLSYSKSEILNFPIIDLTSHSIQMDSDFMISIENFTQFPNSSLWILATAKSRGAAYPTYYRKGDTKDWEILMSKKGKVVGMSFVAFVH